MLNIDWRISEYLINTQYYDIFYVIVHRPDEISATEIALGRQSLQPPAYRAYPLARMPTGWKRPRWETLRKL